MSAIARSEHQVLAALRNEHMRLLFVSALLGFGFVAAKLFGANGVAITVLLLIGLGCFALTLGAALLVFHCEILSLRRSLERRAPDLAARVAAIGETAAQLGFVLALLMVAATVIVHLSLGGIS